MPYWELEGDLSNLFSARSWLLPKQMQDNGATRFLPSDIPDFQKWHAPELFMKGDCRMYWISLKKNKKKICNPSNIAKLLVLYLLGQDLQPLRTFNYS